MFFKYNDLLYMNPKVSRCGRYKLYHKGYNLGGGSVLLTMSGKVLFYQEMQSPNYFDIACNGTVIICDVLGMETESKVFVLDEVGNLIFEKYITANISSCAISDNSEIIFFETLRSKTEHSFKFFLYNLTLGKEIAKYDSPFCAFGADAYIDTNKQQIIFNLKEEIKTIDFHGKLII
jgi:hypothetical protein